MVHRDLSFCVVCLRVRVRLQKEAGCHVPDGARCAAATRRDVATGRQQENIVQRAQHLPHVFATERGLALLSDPPRIARAAPSPAKGSVPRGAARASTRPADGMGALRMTPLAALVLVACCAVAGGTAASGTASGRASSPWLDSTLAFAAGRISATMKSFPAGDPNQPDEWRFPSRTTSKADGQWTQVGHGLLRALRLGTAAEHHVHNIILSIAKNNAPIACRSRTRTGWQDSIQVMGFGQREHRESRCRMWREACSKRERQRMGSRCC